MAINAIRTSSMPLRFPVNRLEEEIFRFFDGQEAFVLLWKFHEVVVGKVVENQVVFYQSALQPEFVQEARIFNETGEMHLVRQEDDFVGRWRKDGDGEKTVECDVHDERHFVTGRIKHWDNGWLKIAEENRGFLLYLPSSMKATGKVCYFVRNYYGCDDDGQLCFVDGRLCGFFTADGTKIRPGGAK